MSLVPSEERYEGTERIVGRYYTLVTCAVSGLLCSFYLYHTCVSAEEVHSRKYLWNFTVTVGLFVFIFFGKLLRYHLSVTADETTQFTLIQIDSMCLALGGLGMTITNYHYDQSGYFCGQYLQFSAKILAAILVLVFYCTSTLNVMFKNAVCSELLSIVALYSLANVPLFFKICNGLLGSNFNYLILMSSCIVLVTFYSSNVIRNRLCKTIGIRQGCPLFDILLFATLTVFVSVFVEDFSRHRRDTLELFTGNNSCVSVWDTLGLSTLIILTILCLTVFFQSVYVASQGGAIFYPNVQSKFGVMVSNFDTFLGSDVQCVFYGSEQIIKV